MRDGKTAFLGLRTGLLVCAAAVCLASLRVTEAGAVTFDFSSHSGLLGNTQTYTSGAFTVTAAGFTTNTFSTPTALYGKALGGDENGLGLQDDPSGDHEISGTNLIRITLPTGLTNVMFQMDSTTGTEGWDVFGSNSATTGYVSLLTGNNELAHPLPLYSYYYFISTGGGADNVLLADLTASPTPLPAALPLFGTVLGAGYWLSKRRRRSTALASA